MVRKIVEPRRPSPVKKGPARGAVMTGSAMWGGEETADGVLIHWETVGSGPDVVLIHGLTDSSATWGPITGMFAERYRVTTLDLRGMGQSGDADDYSMMAMVGDVAAVVG